jgi:hypothetical protein
VTVGELVDRLGRMPQDALVLINYSADLPGESPVAEVEKSNGWYLPDGSSNPDADWRTDKGKIVTVLICDGGR